jgi:hypothetical protein
MKILHLLPLSVCFLPSVLAAQSDKPDGLLGTDFVSVGPAYANVSYDDVDVDFAGVTGVFNKSIYLKDNIGIDVGLEGLWGTNVSYRDDVDADAWQGAVCLNFYRNVEMLSPFFGIKAGYIYVSGDDGSSSASYDSFGYGGVVGVEVHLVPGFSMTPYVMYEGLTEDDVDGQTAFGLKTVWWMTDRVGLVHDVYYSNVDDADFILTSLSAAIHF